MHLMAIPLVFLQTLNDSLSRCSRGIRVAGGVDAVMLAEQVADELLPAASGRWVSIAVHAPDRPADSFIDLYKMARVLGNILKNAVALSSQRMGGDITAMSESGNTVFIIRIPCSSSASK